MQLISTTQKRASLRKAIIKFSGILVALLIIFLWGQSMANELNTDFKEGIKNINLEQSLGMAITVYQQ